MDISGTVAIVTGGASGIGEASARALAERGSRCVVVDLDNDKGRKVASDIGGIFVRADTADAGAVQAAVDAATGPEPLRILVNAAGIGYGERTVDRHGKAFDLDAFERVIRVNLVGTFNVLRLAAAAMARTQPVNGDGARGAIINIASVAAYEGQIGQAAYSASKAGIVGLTLPVARDLAAVGIRVNTIAPGLIDTPIYGQGPQAEQLKSRLAQGVLFPARLGVAGEIASMVLELVRNDYVNGEVVRVDGGIRMSAR